MSGGIWLRGGCIIEKGATGEKPSLPPKFPLIFYWSIIINYESPQGHPTSQLLSADVPSPRFSNEATRHKKKES
jgi:hypothetical protein